MIPFKLKRRNAWPGFDAKTLWGVAAATKEALVDVERNTSDAVDALVRLTCPAWKPVEVSTDYQAQLWDLVIVVADATILIPAASAANRGAEIRFVRIGLVVLTIQPISGLIDGSALSAAVIPNRGLTFCSSGLGWHRA